MQTEDSYLSVIEGTKSPAGKERYLHVVRPVNLQLISANDTPRESRFARRARLLFFPLSGRGSFNPGPSAA